ncbi:MAG TPA: AcvB/VirJ family lysyl-phosphatidylglycerol hydrolase [Pseudomonadales bacterium]|nr:virulence factor family protein [Pseudomonadales bacterium]HNN36482.1 AcvB/VirJ family lysyl-phosphatidylglycerol hydrolase [Pseudomonadales bacterium]
MKRFFSFAMLWLLCLSGGSTLAFAAEPLLTLEASELGSVAVHGQKGQTQQLAILFSSEEGLADVDLQAIDDLVAQGLTVAVIDTRLALQRLQGFNQDCLYLPGPLEWISHSVQQQLGFTHYSKPLLLGRGEGGVLVYASLVQAPALAFAGGVSVDVASFRLGFGKPLCNLDRNRLEPHDQRFDPGYALGGWWQVGTTTALKNGVGQFVKAADEASQNLVTLLEQPAPLSRSYGEAAQQVLKSPSQSELAQTLEDLPLVEVSSQSTTRTLVIIYSGDGGWRDLDQSLGELLKQKDLAVLGIDALRYFWSKRTAEESALDLARILIHYRKAWQIENVVLVGYSFGADILPAIYNHLPAPLQSSVRLISLLVPAFKADFSIQVSGWFGADASDEAMPLAPEIARIDRTKLQCFYGTDEADESLCLDPVMQGSEIIARPGGHHFDENYDIIAEQISSAIQRRLAAKR